MYEKMFLGWKLMVLAQCTTGGRGLVRGTALGFRGVGGTFAFA